MSSERNLKVKNVNIKEFLPAPSFILCKSVGVLVGSSCSHSGSFCLFPKKKGMLFHISSFSVLSGPELNLLRLSFTLKNKGIFPRKELRTI